MTTDVGHGHGHEEPLPFPGFRPSNDYGVLAQNRQLVATRADRDRQVAEARAAADRAEDRATFYEACLAQLKDESTAEIGRLAEHISRLTSELEQARRGGNRAHLDLAQVVPVPDVRDVDDSEVDLTTSTNGTQPE